MNYCKLKSPKDTIYNSKSKLGRKSKWQGEAVRKWTERSGLTILFVSTGLFQKCRGERGIEYGSIIWENVPSPYSKK